MATPNELLDVFLKENNIHVTDIHFGNINENSAGKFDASLDWTSLVGELLQQPTLSVKDQIREIHKSVFVNESENFDDHFIEVECPLITEFNMSVYRYKKFKSSFVFYGVNKQTLTTFIKDQVEFGEDFVIGSFPENTNMENIVTIAVDQSIIQILCSSSEVLFHKSDLPPLFNTGSLPSYIPKMDDSLPSQTIRKGYDLRHVDIKLKPLSMDSLLQMMPSKITLAPVFKLLVETSFDKQVQKLEESIPVPFETSADDIIEWLINRDILHSMYMVVGQWKPSLQEKLDIIDQRFALHKFSHILPSSRLLAEAWRQDPACWWGQNAALQELLSEANL